MKLTRGMRDIPRRERHPTVRNPGVKEEVRSYRRPTLVGPIREARANMNMLIPRGIVMSSESSLKITMTLVS